MSPTRWCRHGWRGALRRYAARRLSRRIACLPAGFPPTLSFTFDDAPANAATIGAGLLEAADMRGTYYIASSLLGHDSPCGPILDPAQLHRLAAAGHEIGGHSFGHLNALEVPADRFAADIAANRAALAAQLPGLAPRSFAYPYGAATWRTKQAALAQYTSCRGNRPGVASGRIDLGLLPANKLYAGQTTAQGLRALMAETIARHGWLILYTHDVGPTPSPYGCTPQDLAGAIELAQSLGLRVATVGDVTAGLEIQA